MHQRPGLAKWRGKKLKYLENRRSVLLARLIAGSALAAYAPAALAQDNGADAPPPPVQDDFADESPSGERIVVTGSRIRGVQSTGSNVIGLDRAAIEAVPTSSTTELLRTVPQNIALGTVEAVGGGGNEASSNPFRSNGVNLRGLGGTATLTLIDGYRSVVMGSFGNFIDPSGIPTLGLERVEVVADGASAIYGSDAVAGVVNLITRKRFDGVEAFARYGFADGGYDEYQAGIIGGATFGSGYVTLSYEYLDKEALSAESRRSFLTADQSQFGGNDYRITQCAPGNIVVGSTFYPLPSTGDTPTAGSPNLCEPNDFLTPTTERHSALLNFGLDLSDDIELFGRGYFTHREGEVYSRRNVSVTVPSSNPYFQSPDPMASSVNVNYDFTDEYGYAIRAVGDEYYQGVIGIRAQIFDGWNIEVAGNWGAADSYADQFSNTSGGRLAAAAADSDPDTALNVFESGAVNNQAVLDNIFSGVFLIPGYNEIRAGNVQIDGSLFSIPGGEVSIALGAEHRWEKNSSAPVFGTVDNMIPLSPFSGTRNVDSIFGEILIPLVSGSNASPGVESLSLSLAGRWEDYSDTGSTTNPKIAIVYEPVDGVTINASYGTSFRAPYIPEATFRASGYGVYIANNFPDPQSPTGLSSGISIAGGNDDLTPASATTYSLGAEFEPIFAPDLRASIYYFNIDYKDQIFSLQGNPLVLSTPAYAPFVIRDPTPEQIQDFLNFGGEPLPIVGTLPTSIDFLYDGRRQNLGRTKMDGIDFNISYNLASDIGDFLFDLNGTKVFNVDQAVAPGAPFQDVLDTINNPISFRARGTVSWSLGPWSAQVFATHTGAYRNDTANDYRIDAHTVFDLRLAREIEWSAGITQLSVSITNVFDADPPHTNTPLGYDPNNADAMGRLVAFTLRQSF